MHWVGRQRPREAPYPPAYVQLMDRPKRWTPRYGG